MKRGALYLLLFAALAGCSRAKPKGWIEWTSDDWGVSVIFPYAPEKTVAPSIRGTVRSEAFTAGDAVRYQLICIELIDELKTNADIERSLDSVKAAVEKNGAGKLREERRDNLGSCPGKRFVFDTRDGRVYTYRCVIRDARTYALGVVSTKAKASAPEVQQFLESLRFK